MLTIVSALEASLLLYRLRCASDDYGYVLAGELFEVFFSSPIP